MRRRLAAAVLLLSGGSLYAAAERPTPGPVRDPYWGTALFQLYQERRHAALVDLMVSQQLQRLPMQADEAEVLRGGLLLDLGLDIEAEQALQVLLARTVAPTVHDRAWHHMARLRYRKGQLDAAKRALDRVGRALPAELRDAQALLRAQVSLGLGDPATAARALTEVAASSPALPFARFNLAVAHLRMGEPDAARPVLDELGRLSTSDEALRSLRDKANLALGTLALQAGDPAGARLALARIRLQGPQSDAALLAFGWAALQSRDPAQARVAFDELSARPSASAAVQEARLARAHALAESGLPAPALAAYEQAVAGFQADHQQLAEQRLRWRDASWIARVLDADPAPGLGVEPRLAALDPALMALWPVLADHAWQQAWARLADLDFAARWLAMAGQQVPVLDDMLQQRLAVYQRRAPTVMAQVRERASGDRQTAQRQLEAAWREAADRVDGVAYASDRERDLAARLHNADAIAAAADPAQTEAARERLRLARGVLAWELARAHPIRHAQATEALQGLRQAGAGIDARLQRIEAARQQEPARMEALAGRIVRLRSDIAALSPQVAVLAAAQRAEIQALVDQALQLRQTQLADQLAQAHWAVAQLHDVLRAEAPQNRELSRAAP